jgi:hypothetical protein
MQQEKKDATTWQKILDESRILDVFVSCILCGFGV